MTIYIRNDKRQTLVDCEVNDKRDELYAIISVGICVRPYSELLLANIDQAEVIISDFDDLDNLPTWYYEQTDYMPFKELLAAIRKCFEAVCYKYNLHIVID